MAVNLGFFRDYDVRGRYPEEINENIFYFLGRAIAAVLKPRRIAIGRDARLSSDRLFLYLAGGLAAEGVKIIDLGQVSTPLCFWYSRQKRTDSLMITASHNPKNENGLKIYSYKLGPVDSQQGMKKIKDKFAKIFFANHPTLPTPTTFKKETVLKGYQRFLMTKAKLPGRKLKVALDFSHGVVGLELIPILEKMRLGFVTLNQTPNGNFPSHNPNPSEEESQKPIKLLMRSRRFDLGAVFDGDGDRVVFLDSRGRAIDAAYIFSLFIDYFARRRGLVKQVVGTASLSKVVSEVTEREGIKLIFSKVGRSYVQRAMRRHRACLGAEKTGHYFFDEFYFGDNGTLAFLKMVEILSQKVEPLARLIKPYQKYAILPELNAPFKGSEAETFERVKRLFPGAKTSRLDGLSVNLGEQWFNLRRSKTENLWRLNLEGTDMAELEKTRDRIIQVVQTQSISSFIL